MSKVIIIGAGIGGIAAATLLARAGHTVTVYEKNQQPGGRAGMLEKDGFRFDTGPSWYLMPEVFEQFFTLIGRDIQTELDLAKLSPAYRVFFEHKPPLTITSNLAEDAKTFEAIEPGAGEALKQYVARSTTIYDASLKHFLYTNFQKPSELLHPDILRRIILLGRLVFTPIDTYVTKHVRDKRLVQTLEYPMVFLGSSPFSAPAIYSLMGALDFNQGVYYPQGGIYMLIERLVAAAKDAGVGFVCDADVQEITTASAEATGIRLADDSQVRADIVVSNADLHHTETQLLATEHQTYPEAYWQKAQAGPSALLMYLGVRGKLPELPHHSLLFIDDWQENFRQIYETATAPVPASIYISKPSATDATVAPKGHENLMVLVPLPPNVSLTKRQLAAYAEQYLKQIERMTGIPDLRERIVTKTLFGPNEFHASYNAWQNTALGPSHVLKQSAFFRTRNKSKKLSNLYYVGGFTVPGVGMPMCLISAEQVFKRIHGIRRGGPLTPDDITGAAA